MSRRRAKKAAASKSEDTGMTPSSSTTAASAALVSARRACEPACLRGRHGHRQDSFRGSLAALQRQFADHRIVFKVIGGEPSAAGEDAQRDRK